jgi:DUF4097 and DUF4098 domain-containing protein YvlB
MEMMRKCLLIIAAALSLQSTFAQDFKNSYSLPSGGQIVVWNYRGDITVQGYEGDTVEIVANKAGPDRDLVKIIDFSYGEKIDVHPRFLKFGHGNATVDFEVRVPKSVEYNFSRLASMGGKVKVSNVEGRLRAESMRGDVEIKSVRGLVTASSQSGNVRVEIDPGYDRSHMRISSISGNIEVLAPSSLDAFVEMSSIGGLLKTDFPIEIQEMRYGSGRSARGKLGTGKQSLHLRSVTGQVSLMQK